MGLVCLLSPPAGSVSHEESIGPEVVGQAVRVLETINAATQDFELNLSTHLIGGSAIDATGQSLPDSTLKACKEADAILLGTLLTLNQVY